MIERLVLFKGDVETQGYFSIQLEKAFRKLGYDVYMYDYKKEGLSALNLVRFLKRGVTAVVTFNFHGICEENILRDSEGVYIWDSLEIPVLNIVVDHPFYYQRFFPQLPRAYYQCSIDENHQAYMERFFPKMMSGPFLPLAGTQLLGEETVNNPCQPISKRSYDVVFTGNYTNPSYLNKYFKEAGAEYEQFYRSIVEELIGHTERTLEEVFIRRIKEEIPEVTDKEICDTLPNMIFMDLYIRYYMRGKVVQTLADAGIVVHVFGGGWDELPCEKPENVISCFGLESEECLKVIRDAKISLNVMPWFKRGYHDRIFNSMCNGAVCVTDSSALLDEILVDGENAVCFFLEHLEALPDKVKALLANPDKMQKIADSGKKLARKEHTWDNRAEVLHKWMRENL